MIYILHGTDISKSRQLILNLFKNSKSENKLELDITQITPQHFLKEVSSVDFFNIPNFVVLDITNAGRSKLDSYLEILQKSPKDVEIVIYSEKDLTKTNIFVKNAKKLLAKVIQNKEFDQSNIFKFIDAVFYKQRTRVYQEYKKIILSKNEDTFKVFSMLLYGLRNVYHAKLSSEVFMKMSPFVQEKALRQSENFTLHQLNQLFEDLYYLDKAVKTGELDSELFVTLAIEKVLA